jgi:hypothetical protein
MAGFFGELFKGAAGKGGLPFSSMLAAMGIKATFNPVPPANVGPTVADFLRRAGRPGAEVALIRGTAPNGASIIALSILSGDHSGK